MKAMACLIGLAGAITLAGCASPPMQVAQASKECKIAPAMTQNTVTQRRQPTELDRRYAEMQLRSTPYYQQAYRDRADLGTVGQAARDCD